MKVKNLRIGERRLTSTDLYVSFEGKANEVKISVPVHADGRAVVELVRQASRDVELEVGLADAVNQHMAEAEELLRQSGEYE